MNVDIIGIDQASRQIADIPKRLLNKGVREGTKAVGKEASRDLASAVPIKTGVLRRSVSSKLLAKRAGEVAAVKIGGLKKVARKGEKATQQDYILRFLEAGTKQHMLKAWDSNGKRLNSADIRKANSAGQHLPRSVLHPGIKGRGLLKALSMAKENEYAQVFRLAVESALSQVGLS